VWSLSPSPLFLGNRQTYPPDRRSDATHLFGKGVMFKFNINLTSLAVIIWSGMLIISGSILILSSQVRKVADLMQEYRKPTAPAEFRQPDSTAVRIARRGSPIRDRGGVRAIGSARQTPRISGPVALRRDSVSPGPDRRVDPRSNA
jgi:hypothetical protein